MTTYVGCPGCGVKYPLKQLYHHAHDRPSQSKVYTVVCAVCGQQFDVGFRRRWRGLLPLRPSGPADNSAGNPLGSCRFRLQLPIPG